MSDQIFSRSAILIDAFYAAERGDDTCKYKDEAAEIWRKAYGERIEEIKAIDMRVAA